MSLKDYVTEQKEEMKDLINRSLEELEIPPQYFNSVKVLASRVIQKTKAQQLQLKEYINTLFEDL